MCKFSFLKPSARFPTIRAAALPSFSARSPNNALADGIDILLFPILKENGAACAFLATGVADPFVGKCCAGVELPVGRAQESHFVGIPVC